MDTPLSTRLSPSGVSFRCTRGSLSSVQWGSLSKVQRDHFQSTRRGSLSRGISNLDLVTDLGQLLLYSKDYEKAESLDREIYDATKVVYGDDTIARFHAVAYHCIYLCRVGQEGQAYKELDEFRNVAKEDCSEELLERLLYEIDEIERSMIEEEQLNTILSN